MAVGARNFLIAYNVNLKSQDVALAKAISKQVREKEIEEAIAAEAPEAPAAPVKPRVKNPNLRGGTGTPGPLFPQLGQK